MYLVASYLQAKNKMQKHQNNKSKFINDCFIKGKALNNFLLEAIPKH